MKPKIVKPDIPADWTDKTPATGHIEVDGELMAFWLPKGVSVQQVLGNGETK